MTSTPIRYLLCGKAPGHLAACTTISKPEFEGKHDPLSSTLKFLDLAEHAPPIVLTTASSVEDAKSAISELLIDASERKIQFVAMGGGFTPADFNQVHPLASNLPWFRPIQSKPGYGGPALKGPPSAEDVSSRLRKSMEEHLEDLRAGKGAGEVWYF